MEYRVNTIQWEARGMTPNPDRELESVLNARAAEGYTLVSLYALPVPCDIKPLVVVITGKPSAIALCERAAETVSEVKGNFTDGINSVKEMVKDVYEKLNRDGEQKDATV